MKRQPVITGLGIVSPIGVGVETFWAAAKAGKSGIRTPTLFDSSKLPSDCKIVGEVPEFNPVDWMPGRVARPGWAVRSPLMLDSEPRGGH